MTTMPATAVPANGSTVRALGLLETKRLARHPVFLVGFVANAVLLGIMLDTDFDYYNVAILPGFFIGLFSTVAMYRLTRSMETAQPAVDSSPVTQQERVLALCSATVLPAVVGLLSFAAILLFKHPTEPLSLAGIGTADRVAIFFGEIVIACIGGPLLGVAAGRWLRFPGGSALIFVGLLVWILLGEGTTDQSGSAGWANAVRLSSPWNQFTSVDAQLKEVQVWGGSPWWYLGWLAALCGLALLGALLKGSEGAQRTTLLRTGAVVGAAGLVCWVLAVTTGLDPALHTVTGVKPL